MRKLGIGLCIVLILTGCIFLVYPFLQRELSKIDDISQQTEYQIAVAALSEKECEDILQEAIEYNNHLDVSAFSKQYNRILNVNEMIGIMYVPRLNISLSIYHGTSEEVLAQGVGHLEASALPVGELSTHAVLCGHSGLPSISIFDDLDQLRLGDEISIQILNRELHYHIDQIETVLPEDVQPYLQTIPNKSFVTLVTCTPYGVNTHRLLIRAELNSITDAPTELASTSTFNSIWFFLVLSVIFMLIVGSIYRWKRRRKNNAQAV